MIYFVTGEYRGIGAGIVKEAITQGHDVAFTYLGNKKKSEAIVAEAEKLRPGCKCRCYKLDVRDSDDVEKVGDQVLEDFETVQVVVNNAAINSDNLAVSMSDEEWHDVLSTNLYGPFYVSRYFLTEMLTNRFGRIINISSVSAGGASGQVNYASAKAGLTGLTRTLAKEYGRKGITANIVIPGFFDTEMTQNTMSEKFKEFWNANCPIKRVGDVVEIAKVVCFLGSEASSYINGDSISVTGGLDHAA